MCDYTDIPKPANARPWAAVQAVAAHHASQAGAGQLTAAAAPAAAPASAGGFVGPPGVLRVVLANRTGRRRLANLEELAGSFRSLVY